MVPREGNGEEARLPEGASGSLLLQFAGDALCPGRDGTPIAKVAQRSLDPLDDQFLRQADLLHVDHAVEESRVARMDAVGDGLQVRRKAEAVHQLDRIALAGWAAREEPYRTLR